MTTPARVIVLTLSFGSGHARAAAAVVDALKDASPQAEVRCIDALAGCRLLFRAAYVWPYWVMVRYAPALWRRLFESRLRRRSERTAPAWLFRLGCPRVFRAIEAFDPDVIVAAEVGACEIADIAARLGQSRARVIDVITDHHAEPAWVKADVYAYAVADDAVARQLTAWGAPAERIVVCGIPADARFAAAPSTRAHRPPSADRDPRPTVLLMGGGMGPTRMDDVVAGLCATGIPMRIVAIAGRDRRAHRRLGRIRATAAASVTVLGWCDDVPAMMHAATLLVTKPGGVTTTEAALCGLPVVCFDAIPGPEEHNAARLASVGAGVRPRGRAGTVAAVLELLRDDEARAGMSRAARAHARPGAAASVARLVIEACHSQEPEPPRVVLLTISNGAGHTRAAEAVVALEPPPGAERIQYRRLAGLRRAAASRPRGDAAASIAGWIASAVGHAVAAQQVGAGGRA